MPIILARPPLPPGGGSGSGRATLNILADTTPLPGAQHGLAVLNLRAMTLQGGRARLAVRSSSRTESGSATLPLIARTGVQTGRARLILKATTHATQTGSSQIFIGRRARRFRMTVQGGLRVISFDYTHRPQGREITMVVAGVLRLAAGNSIDLQITALDSGETFSISVPSDGEYQIEHLPAGGARTTLRGADPEYTRLGVVRLDELIPWVGNPSRDLAGPGYRSATRQVRTVKSVLTEAFQAAGQTVSVPLDALSGQRWEETRREYSTQGKTPLDVWRDTYGALNYELVWIRENQWKGFKPGEVGSYLRVPDRDRLPGGESRQILQYPSSVRVQVGDVFTSRTGYLETVATDGELPDSVKDPSGHSVKLEIRDQQTAVMEASADAVLTGVTANPDGTLATYYVQKSGGRVVRTIDLILGSFSLTSELSVPPGFNPARRDFRQVVLSFSETTNFYLSETSSTLSSTRTVTTRYAYSFDVKLADLALPEGMTVGHAGQSSTLKCGALLGAEQSSEVYVYSHQGGHLRSKTTSEEKITGIGQTDADSTDPAHPPGIPTALESARTVTLETWTPVGGGLWRASMSRSQPARVPVRDLTTGDWLKQMHAPLVTVSTKITDNAPPAVADPDIPAPDAQGGGTASEPMFPTPPPFEYLRDPQIQVVPLTGLGEQGNVSVPVVEDNQGQLARGLGKIWAAELLPRTTYILRAPLLFRLSPRTRIEEPNFGMVRSFRIGGRAGEILTEATCELRTENV